ncbi:ribosome-associated protein [Mumia flava]|uniref:Ribosome-associated protein n=1 Tax=Mumia flava TaxID=1348852 RepID=A0A0B2B2E7_9ACTN|nr:alternative ribosome rescue aminoacyl-tRNA hydrolase ArfB [Mumia flava]PJJ57606.1 ribosome-associated protein [Mumia flava]
MPDGVAVTPGPGVPDGLTIPESELSERFSRSPGPGGQSVNTADSRVELTYDVNASEVLTAAQRRRVVRSLGRSTITVVASEHRSQLRNRSAARERLGARLRAALAPPPRRRVPTKPTRGSQRRRLDAKRRRGETKARRGRVSGED